MKTKKVELKIRTFEDIDPELLEAQGVALTLKIDPDVDSKIMATAVLELNEIANRLQERDNKGDDVNGK